MTLASPDARDQFVQSAAALFARCAGSDPEPSGRACNQVPCTEMPLRLAPVLGVFSEEALRLSQRQLAADAAHLAEDGVQFRMTGRSGQ